MISHLMTAVSFGKMQTGGQFPERNLLMGVPGDEKENLCRPGMLWKAAPHNEILQKREHPLPQ